MNFNMKEAIELLERTPRTLEYFLVGISTQWMSSNEGDGTWNISEVIEHLIEGEKNNWLPRLEFILREGESKPFPEFNRFSHLEFTCRPIEQALSEFKTIREQNLKELRLLIKNDTQLETLGFHPALGTIKIRELLSTWTVHDLTHISQIARIMAERYRKDVGPWVEYLGILNKK